MGWFTRDPDARFWSWFAKNQERLLGWQTDPHGAAAAVAKPLGKVARGLTFEFGPVVNGVGQFIVSADGNRSLFPVVERLVAAAPSFSRWRITAFRPRRTPMAMRIGHRTVRPEDLRFIAFADGDRIGVTLLIAGWTPDSAEVFDHFAWVFLDQALGEETVETRLGIVDVAGPTDDLLPQSRPLADLARTVDEWPAARPPTTSRPLAKYPAESTWTMLQGADDGVPIVVRRNDRADELMLHRDYRHRVVVEIPFRAPTPNGLRAREEAQPINAIEDLVTAALERERASLLALVVNGGGKTALVYYTRAPEIVAAAVRDAEARVPAYRIQHRVDDDPAWEFYRAFLGNSRSG